MTWVTSLETFCYETTATKLDVPSSYYNECIDTCEIDGNDARLFYWPTPTTTDTFQYASTAVVDNFTL